MLSLSFLLLFTFYNNVKNRTPPPPCSLKYVSCNQFNRTPPPPCSLKYVSCNQFIVFVNINLLHIIHVILFILISSITTCISKEVTCQYSVLSPYSLWSTAVCSRPTNAVMVMSVTCILSSNLKI